MRELSQREKTKRGCIYCADRTRPKYRMGCTTCPYDECPYHELDNFKSYDEYMKKSKKGGLARLLEALAKNM